MTKKSVVICDDDQTMVYIVRAFLTKKDFIVHTADNGDAAVKLVKAVKPQLLLLDIDMPGKNGFEVLEAVRGEAGKLYKIIVSGHEDKASHDRARALGADEVWVKPFNAAKLLAGIETLVAQGKI